MPQLSSGDVWSCLERSRTHDRRQQDGKEEEKEMLDEMNSREEEEETERAQGWMRLHWRNWPRWSQCLFPVAVVLLVLLDESPLNPFVSLSEAGARLLLAGLLCAAVYLCLLAFQFLRDYKMKLKQVPWPNGKVMEKVAANQQTCITAQQDAGHLVAKVNVLADGLVVSVLHEPLPDPSEPHIRDLLTRLEAVSRALQKGVSNEEDQVKCPLQDRMNHIKSYLQDRASALRSLLQVQRESEVSVCDVQTGLQKYWALLEKLHTSVTLKPDSKQELNDLRTVLKDTENLFTEIGQFKSKVQQCRMQLENCIQLLQALRSSHQALSQTVTNTVDSAWTKTLLQTNTDLFSEIHEDFTSLEQQTSNFVIHLRGLNAAEEKTILADSQSSPRLSLPAVPVYTAVSEAEQSHSDPESDSESPQKSHSKLSPFHLLCGARRRRSSP